MLSSAFAIFAAQKKTAMYVANPLYDIVFKYLMEDMRIAKTILSALLKKDVIDIEVRPHEYSNISRDNLSIFRIDFGATIKETDGSIHLILIEVQKTWVDTETLRFRQYLGVQYSNPNNIDSESKEGYALPMVAVYILGHKVGDVEEPVLYVHHQTFDYNGNLVTKGIPNPFLESLTHDSIIVQIPRLHGRVNNRLDKVLSLFDQSQKSENNQQVLCIDENSYRDDEEMMHIVHRLVAAAADPEVRHNMNVEDEYYSIIEKKDTALMMRDKQLAERTAQLSERTAQLSERTAQLSERTTQLSTSIKMLLGAGLSPEQISAQLGIDIQMVKDLME